MNGIDARSAESLRRAMLDLGRRFGCFLHDDVSTAFLVLVPAEVAAVHDRRVTELIEANNREVARRRKAEEELERMRMEVVDQRHEAYVFHDTSGHVRAVVSGRLDLIAADIAELLAIGLCAKKLRHISFTERHNYGI